MKLTKEQDNELQKVANHLGEQMSRLIRVKDKPSYDDLKDKHIKSIRTLDELKEVDERIARQRAWLRSNLNADPEEKLKMKSRLEEMKELKSELLDKYTELQLP